MISKDALYVIVGASNNKEKYGYKVLKDLKSAGYSVIPVNPHEKEILGIKTYPRLSAILEKIDIVVFVVPPAVTEKVLEEVKKLNLKFVWLQPGSGSKKAVEFCNDNNIECIHDSCIMVKRR